MIDLLFFVVALYISVFTWITKKDIRSNNKNDFYVPAYFLIAFSAIGIFVVTDGSTEGRLSAIFIFVFATPLILQLLAVGSQQDLQKARGDLTYNVGDRFWIVQTKGIYLTPEQAVYIGREGWIQGIHYEDGDKTASMRFDEKEEWEEGVHFKLGSLSNIPPVAEQKDWWVS